MSTRTIWYRCLTHCDKSFYELKTPGSFDLWTAHEVAEEYHSEHDGWDDEWPLEFSLHETENGPEIARFEVQREFEPVFYATVITRVEERE